MNKHRYKKYEPIISTLSIASASLFLAPVAVSQPNTLKLEEVVVTVRRREEMEQDVPISMNVMTEDYLRVQNITKVEDIGTKIPSLRISGAGGSLNEPLISLRGQRPSVPDFSQDQAVPMYFNEVAISPSQGSNLGLYDLQNVQVLKGPQGTLFGRNSTGGAVLMTPKRPGTELGGYAEVKVGDYNLMGFEGAVDVPVSDSLRMRISAHKLDRDGYQENIADNELHGRKYDDEHSEGGRISVSFEQDRLTNLLVAALDENKITAAVPYATGSNSAVGLGWAAGLGFFGPVYPAAIQDNIDRNDPWHVRTDVDSEEYVKNVFASNTTEFELTDNMTTKNIFGYRKVDFETATDIDGTEFPGWGTWTNGAPGVTWDARPTKLHSEFFSDELQLLGSALDDQLEWIVGAYWSKVDATQDYLVQTSPAGIDSGITTALNTSYGLFAETTYSFNDQWSLTTGIRQSWDKRELTVSKWTNVARTACNVTGPGGTMLTDCARTVDETFDSPTWRVSANYTPSYGGLTYASVSTGYRGGGFNTRGNSDITLVPFNEETVTTYEIGYKNDWDIDGAALRTNAALYYQDYQDIQHTKGFDDNGVIVSRTLNAAKAAIQGLELEVTYAPTELLTFSASYSYVDAEFKERSEILGQPPFQVDLDTSSDDFVYIPKQSATFSTTFTLPLDPGVGDVSLTVSAYWQDEMNTNSVYDQFNQLPRRTGGPWTDEELAAAREFSEVDAYDVWDMRIDWRNVMESNFDVAAYVKNAFDEQYVLGGLNVIDTGGYGGYLYGAPRTIGASLRYTF